MLNFRGAYCKLYMIYTYHQKFQTFGYRSWGYPFSWNSGKCYSIRHWKFLEIQGEMFHRMESAQSVIALAGCFESPCIYIQHSLYLTTWTKHSISRVSCMTSAIKRAFGVGTIGVDMTVVSFRVAFFNVCNKYGHYGKTTL